MNQKIVLVKRGKVKVLTNPCALRRTETTTYMVGCQSCKTCPFFVKEVEREDGRYIHCDHVKAHQS